MTSLHAISGLGTLHSKILATPMNWRLPEKLFLKRFFWKTLAAVSLVLGLGLKHSCRWPREGLSLASRWSVLGRAVIGLGFFVSLALASSLVSSTPPLLIFPHIVDIVRGTPEVNSFLVKRMTGRKMSVSSGLEFNWL